MRIFSLGHGLDNQQVTKAKWEMGLTADNQQITHFLVTLWSA